LAHEAAFLAKQGQPSFPPPAGSYTGQSPQFSPWRISFEVSTNGMHLQAIGVSQVSLGCMPAKTIGHPFAIGEAPIAADGSFSATAEESAIVEGVHAKVTYTFSGHFHGADSAGKPRAAGVFREDIKFESGVTKECTSNNQSWSATAS
jgi:hypothetical protein